MLKYTEVMSSLYIGFPNKFFKTYLNILLRHYKATQALLRGNRHMNLVGNLYWTVYYTVLHVSIWK